MVSMSSNGQSGAGNVGLGLVASDGPRPSVSSAGESGPSRSSITQPLVECHDNVNNNNENRNCNNTDSGAWKILQDPSKMNKLQEMVQSSTSEASKCVVESLLQQVNQLSDLEKFLLYLKLPVGRSPELDPLKQPLNPLGSRSEIQLTITWMKTHLEIDLEVSLPKEEVYNEYMHYCNNNGFKPLSTADFGKVMKQVFPSVRARRLGQRGASKYCHSGLKKKYVLDVPSLPDLSENSSSNSSGSMTNKNMFGLDVPCDEELKASLSVIMEWAEKMCNIKFETFHDLALYLLENNFVDKRSVAAFTLFSLDQRSGTKMGKHRETQFQLQRKLQEREHIREQKRKLQQEQPPGISKSCTDRPKTRRRSGTSRNVAAVEVPSSATTSRCSNAGGFGSSKTSVSESKVGNNQCVKFEAEPKKRDAFLEEDKNGSNLVATTQIKQEEPQSRLPFHPVFNSEKEESYNINNNNNNNINNNNCGNTNSNSTINKVSSHQKFIRANSVEELVSGGSNLVKGTTSSNSSPKTYLMLSNLSPSNNLVNSNLCHKNRYKPIQPKVGHCENNNINNSVNNKKINNLHSTTQWIEAPTTNAEPPIARAVDVTPSGTFPSLVTSLDQFQMTSTHQPTSHSDSMVNPLSLELEDVASSYAPCERDDHQKSQLSELRKLLQKNLPGSASSSISSRVLADDHPGDLDQEGVNSGNIRRRVSFQTSIDGSEVSPLTPFAPSLNQDPPLGSNTVTKSYNFTPITNQPCGNMSQGVSQASSANASPFMSPRNTPLPRSRHNSGQTSSTYVTPRSTPYTPDIPIQGNGSILSENSTPFMSPAPTPLLSRSRHNSSQSMRPHYTPTGRTRHSSGAPNFRPTPYADDCGRRNKYRSRHSSGSIPPSPHSAPLSPLVHDSNSHPLTDPLLFHHHHLHHHQQQQQRGNVSMLIKHPSQPQPAPPPQATMMGGCNDLRRRHLSAGPTIHYQPPHNPSNYGLSASTLLNNDPLAQEVSNVMNNPEQSHAALSSGSSNRPQSVPLPQMLNTSCSTDMDYIAKSHPNTPLVNQHFQFGPDCSLSQPSSYAPTPVPSEYTDFGEYSNLDCLDSVLSGEPVSGNSGLENIDSLSNLTTHPDFVSAISESLSGVGPLTRLVDSSYTESNNTHFPSYEDAQSILQTSIESSCPGPNNTGKENLESATDNTFCSKADPLPHNPPQPSLSFSGNSQITLNALNVQTMFNVGDSSFDPSHLEEDFQSSLVDFGDQDDFNAL